jgi:hypothetical protein
MYQKKSIYTGSEKEIKGIIYKKKIIDNKITLYLKGKEKIVINYYEDKETGIATDRPAVGGGHGTDLGTPAGGCGIFQRDQKTDQCAEE